MADTEDWIALDDGRRLNFAVFGDPDGLPVVYCHGFPASRLEAKVLSKAAGDLGICLISPDRPGIGDSDHQPRRRIIDWPQDIERLAITLGFERFSVLAVSGGAPYALACAQQMPERVERVVLVAAIGPVARPDLARHMRRFSRFGLAFARERQALFARLADALSPGLFRHPRFAFRIKETSEADRCALSREAVRSSLFQSVQESVRQGGRGVAWDLALLARPWGFPLKEISTPVRLWHGLDDQTVPALMSEFLANSLPHATLSLLAGEGHVSLSADHAHEILAALVRAETDTPGTATTGESRPFGSSKIRPRI
jgi:pimeloyl-ACP methyl ester carboxylesterase